MKRGKILVDGEGFCTWIIFKNGVIAGRDLNRIFDCTPQLKTNTVFTPLANRKTIALE
jgi:hypothetical protein